MITIHKATTEADRVSTIALREAVLGRSRDANDMAGSTIFGAWQGPLLVGTLRLTLRREQPLLGDVYYQWDSLAVRLGGAFDLAQVAAIDRGCVDPRARRAGVFRALLEGCCAKAATREAPIMVCAVGVGNDDGHATFRRLGFLPYGEPAGAPGRPCNHFVLDRR